jgi:ribonucleotide monophosphatase NagD (HAD superfamily)
MSGPVGEVRALLLDLDGVLYVEDEPVPGAREAVGVLRERGLTLRFVTNTTARARRRILDRLDRLGFRRNQRSSAARLDPQLTPAMDDR